ncbi:hypothetical protein FAGAP_9863 [Fusarium agapanthi]|uniref:Uncharacterized protein n=1 Tax=Fusarium agapanthi TaxID=1803897 RepID=A0A9P5B277_9HYPO|nr:hypothetical protein FAGAP_9863 [Fusarium agapanthi]
MGDSKTQTYKRQRLFLAKDPDLTPRPDPIRASSVCSNASGRSRSSSPLKRQFLELRLDTTGVETRAITVDGLMAIPNPEATCLLRIIRRISAYKGFLPDRLGDEILQNHNTEEGDTDNWDSSFQDSSAFDNLPGRIPSPAKIRLINEWTIECIEFKQEEAEWLGCEWKLLAILGNFEEEVGSLKNDILRLRQRHSTSIPGGGTFRFHSSNIFEFHASIDVTFARPSIPVGLTERQDDISSTVLLGIYAAGRQTRPKDSSIHLSQVSTTSAGTRETWEDFGLGLIVNR